MEKTDDEHISEPSVKQGSYQCGGAARWQGIFPTVTRTEFATGRAKQFLDKFYDGSLEKFLTILNGGKQIDAQQVKKIMG